MSSIQIIAESPAAVRYPTLRQDLDAAELRYAFTSARLAAYDAKPALDEHGEPMRVPLKFVIANNTAAKKLAAARAAYTARYAR